MKTDGWSLIRFSLAASGIAVAALLLAARPALLSARNSQPASREAPAAVAPPIGQAGTAQAGQEPAQKTAGQVYMNLQVLKDVPSDQLIPAMQYITAALGVECNYCHDTKHFDNDDKQPKLTARKMMQMMFAIDKDNFNGRREVTCYTCHRAAAKPQSVPVLSASTTEGQAAMGGSAMSGRLNGVSMGTGMRKPPESGSGANANASNAPAMGVDAILAKYTEAIGGSAAIEKITTLDEKGAASMRGMKVDVELIRKAPGKAVATVHMPNGGAMSQGYDGATAWRSFPGRPAEELTWDDLARARQWASFIPGVNIKQDFARAQAAGTEKIGDQDAYRVIAFRKGGGRVIFYFDTQSGLLLRTSERIESPLGSLPQDTDYSDYRDVNGVKLPFSVTVARVQGSTIYKWDQIQANVPVEDGRFAKPEQKAAQP